MSKLRTLIFALAVSTSVIHGYCQEKPSILSHEIAPHWYIFNQPGYIVKTDNNIPLLVKDFIPICKEEFGLGERDELRPKDGFRATPTGVAKYQQYYDGYEVEGATVIVESKRDTVIMVSSYLVGNLDLNTSNPIEKSEALSVALDTIAAMNETFIWQDSVFVNAYCNDYTGECDSTKYKSLLPQGELCVSRRIGAELDTENFKFVWRFYIGCRINGFRVLVDANTGELIDVFNDARNSGQYAFANVQTLYDGFVTGKMETFKPLGETQWTLQNSRGNTTLLNNNPVYDYDNVWDNYISAPASTAHWIIGELEEFYRIKYLNYHITDNILINAGVDTVSGGSYYHPLNRISIGKLGSNWATTIDIVGHELAHRLNKQTANLLSQCESGALEESFADIFGTLAERYIRTLYGASWNWTIGEDAGTVRDMANPALYGQPEYYHGINWHNISNPSSTNDYGGVHTNCGVSNKWFYNLSQSIGPNKAGLIAYYMLNLYLSSNSDFHDALQASVSAAANLYGNCSDERNAVISAWSSVGVSSPYILHCHNTSPGNDNERMNIEQNNEVSFHVSAYPNPASNSFYVEFSEDTNGCIISIYNVLGSKIKEVTTRGKNATIDTTNTPNGLYYVNVVADGIYTDKVKIVISK